SVNRSRRNGRSCSASATYAPRIEPPGKSAERKRDGRDDRRDQAVLAHRGEEARPIGADVEAKVRDQTVPQRRRQTDRRSGAHEWYAQCAGERRNDGADRRNESAQEKRSDAVSSVECRDLRLGGRSTAFAEQSLVKAVCTETPAEPVHYHRSADISQPSRDEGPERSTMAACGEKGAERNDR